MDLDSKKKRSILDYYKNPIPSYIKVRVIYPSLYLERKVFEEDKKEPNRPCEMGLMDPYSWADKGQSQVV